MTDGLDSSMKELADIAAEISLVQAEIDVLPNLATEREGLEERLSVLQRRELLLQGQGQSRGAILVTPATA